jgi:serine phosphatase RsbU (regulator of sigma subunit)
MAGARPGPWHPWHGRPLAALVLALVVLAAATHPGPFGRLQLLLFDAYQRMAPRQPKSLPVVIVGIDEASLAVVGQWPWPRSRMATLVDRIADAGALMVGFDILFAEPDRLSPAALAETRGDLSPELRAALAALPSNDALLARALGRIPVVVSVAASDEAEPVPMTVTPVAYMGSDPKPLLPRFRGLIRNVAEIDGAAAGRGAINLIPEADGITRRVPLLVVAGDAIVPSLAVELLRLAAGAGALGAAVEANGVRAVVVQGVELPTQADGRAWIRFAPALAERYVSAVDVLEGRVGADRLKGRIVLVGATAAGLGDDVATPLAAAMPGVEVHAQTIENVVDGATPRRPAWLGPVELALAAALGGLMVAFLPLLPVAWYAAPVAGLIGLLGGGSWLGFAGDGVLLDPVVPAVSVAATGVVLGASALAVADAARRRLRLIVEEQRIAAQRLEGELTAARSIQMGSLPGTFPAFPDRHDIDVFAAIEPARSVGGDFYDYFFIDDDRLFFIIADVSGKGVPAALFMALTKALCKSTALRRKGPVATIVAEANADIARENATMMFVTAYAGILDVRTGDFDALRAAHEAPFLVASAAGARRLESEGGPPLCILDDYPYRSDRGRLAPDETLVLVTDGVTEAMNPAKELFGAERAAEALARLAADPAPRHLVEGLLAAVRAFAAGAEQSDDITILALRRPAAANGPSPS